MPETTCPICDRERWRPWPSGKTFPAPPEDVPGDYFEDGHVRIWMRGQEWTLLMPYSHKPCDITHWRPSCKGPHEHHVPAEEK